ncbi:hypothetical protein [Sphingomonas sp. 3-13AW]|uniref:hypothetical protein n=1 Tax=Sphingomonas sp. 3-13AW TaxID=3050450 RepID=UPI003BB7AD37
MNASQISHLIDTKTFRETLPNTEVRYLYRDACNYKQSAQAVLEGALPLEQAIAVTSALDDNCWFVPSGVGLEDLQERFGTGWDKDADHLFHELVALSLTEAEATEQETAQTFHDRFLAADWAQDEASVMTRYA